ncbi:hypothetical protein [Bradyrhizobium sp. 170]|uniref:hypothetical protein n=1 Tax=Bradyrhizobium sp. 170 TaxID=2782641 RepID=UPI001FFF00A4|nr:hypothetical protein [Bradyrhizobium sp. 170]UPK05021.1 hypothetical protein IVB05_04645 [Bradyrhizobium sp. 170]
MRAAWLIWLVTTLVLSVYFVSGYIASRTVSIPIVLSAGFIVNQELFRFGHDRLRMELEFSETHTHRPELGESGVKGDWRSTGRLEFPNPGTEILLKASSELSEIPTAYSALPKSSHNQFHTRRDLVAELNEAPGIWKWPPTNFGLALRPGINDIRIEVATVGPKLDGEGINLIIRPEIGFKACGSQVCWLWGWFAWPLFLLIQLIWAGVLLKRGSRRTAP